MSEEIDGVIKVLVEEMGVQKKALHLALNRKRRALEALSKADSDIAAISGALAALEGIARRMGAKGSRQAPPQESEPKPEPVKYITLSGEQILE